MNFLMSLNQVNLGSENGDTIIYQYAVRTKKEVLAQYPNAYRSTSDKTVYHVGNGQYLQFWSLKEMSAHVPENDGDVSSTRWI